AKKFACTGVFIECNACSATILTSASLVRVPGDAHMIDDTLRIEVCLPNKFRVVGILKGYNLHYNVALVDIIGCWDPHAIQISGRPVTSSMDVIAVGCLFAYRKLMAVEGKVLIGKQSKFDCTELCVSTCKITKAGIGGPLIDTDGNFVGMNFYDEEETPFLPRDLICRLLLNVNKEWWLVQMILLWSVTKTDGCCLAGHTEILMETDGRCLSHVLLVLEMSACRIRPSDSAVQPQAGLLP
uniref:Uncharacterized protein n=1 Tax=Aegilops tauschii subsp. strangulata TaxID=200361 RepID=A0A453LF19_AEGTS